MLFPNRIFPCLQPLLLWFYFSLLDIEKTLVSSYSLTPDSVCLAGQENPVNFLADALFSEWGHPQNNNCASVPCKLTVTLGIFCKIKFDI